MAIWVYVNGNVYMYLTEFAGKMIIKSMKSILK